MNRNLTFVLTGMLVFGGVAVGAGEAAKLQQYIELSRTAETNGDLGSAIEMLKRARENAAPEAWRACTRRMMALTLRQGNAAGAQKLLTEFRQAYPDADQAGCQVISGCIAFAEGRYRDAVEELRTAAADSSLSREEALTAWRTIVRAQLAMQQYGEAEQSAAKLEETADTEEERFWGRSRLIFARIMGGDPASAAPFFQEREKSLTPDETRLMDKLELLYWLRTGDFDRFSQSYGRVTAGISSDVPDEILFLMTRMAGEYLQKNGRAREGEAYFRQAISFAPGEALQKRTRIQLIDCCIAAEDYVAAAEAIRRYLDIYKDEPKAVEMRFNRARLLGKGGQAAAAVSVLHELLHDEKIKRTERFAAGREAVDVAVAAKDAGLEANALRVLETFAAGDDEKSAVSMLYGHYEYRSGRYDAAAAKFAAAATGANRETAHFWQLQSLMKGRQFAAALPVAESLLKAKSEETRRAAAFYRAEALEHTGKVTEAIAGYLDYLEAFPGSLFRPSAMYRAAVLLSGEKKYGQSQQLFASFAAAYPENDLAPAALLAMQKAAFLNGDEKGMIQAVDGLQKQYPASPCTAAALFRMVDYYRVAERTGEAMQAIAGIEAISGGDAAQLAQCMYDRAVILEKESPRESCQILTDLAARYPQAAVLPDAMLLLGNLQANLGEYAAAAESYGKAAQLRPTGRFNEVCRERRADSLVNEAARSGDQSLLTGAAAEYAGLAESSDPAVWGAAVFKQGRAQELTGNTRGALHLYKEVLYRAAVAVEHGQMFDRLWAGKALYAAVRLYAGRRSVSGAREALRLIALARELKLETDPNEYSRLEEELRNRIRF